MKAILLPLLALVVAGSLAKADSLDYKYTWHIDGVVLPDDGVQLPSMEIAFLAGNDLYLGKAAIYDYNETDTNVKLLYVRESVSPSSPNYINLFTEFSAFHLGGGLHAVVDNGLVTESFMGGNVAGYDEFGTALPVVAFGNGTIYGYSFTAGDPEKALTTDTLRLEMVPEPGAASLLALGLVGIMGLAMWRRRGAGGEI